MPDEPAAPRISRRAVLRTAALSALALPPAWTFFGESRLLEVVQQEVRIRDLPSGFDGYRIGQISDFHYPRNMPPEFARFAIGLLMAEKPDLIVMTGDFFDGHTQSTVVPDLRDITAGLSASDGVFGCLGNHEIALNKRGATRELEMGGLPILINDYTRINRRGESIRIASVDDIMYGEPIPSRALTSTRETTVLLCHNPDYAENHDPSLRVDLMLSGHTHGGEVVLPFVGATFVPSRYGEKYRAGLVFGPRFPVFVSKGVGSPRHMRWGARPDVAVITLRAD
ncbi:MAG: metallophosphoesterase [Fimbriimonadaceae bacterium]|nr:metallophosphoesterase [Fimbriimonadaceae bacterium]